MGAFAGKGTVKITVPEREGEFIEIKATLSVGERNRLMDAIMAEKGSGTKDAERLFRVGTYSQTLLEAAVVGWRLLDDEGQPVAYKHALITELDPDDALVDKVLGEIAVRYPLGGKKKSDD